VKTTLIQQGQAKGVPMQEGTILEGEGGKAAAGNSGDSGKNLRGRKKSFVANEAKQCP